LKRVFDGENKDPVVFIVGPEGGLDPSEITKAEEYGVESVSLGPRILRTETAGPVLAALALYARDEMEPVNG
jgi:16S rRNA (uracil1498-N3)-methyltransferase